MAELMFYLWASAMGVTGLIGGSYTILSEMEEWKRIQLRNKHFGLEEDIECLLQEEGFIWALPEQQELIEEIYLLFWEGEEELLLTEEELNSLL